MTSENLVEQSTALLHRLLEMLCDYPRDLTVEPREHRGLIHWLVVSNCNDLGKIIGKEGAHIKAVQHLMREIGQHHGCQMAVRVDKDGTGERLPEMPRRPASPTYSPAVHRQLLFDLLVALCDERPVLTVERDGTEFAFLIQPLVVQDFDRLCPLASGAETETILNSLATLFNAAGRRDGVVFRLEVRA